MDKRLLILVFLISGFAFSQTTVTLQDQCNCEVLSGTAVTAAGGTTPIGADIGDIYVNTNTGVIYFWDGNSWELTSSDNQQLQNFNFNGATNSLELTIENGNTVSVDLSALNNAGTDDQLAIEVPYDNTTSGLTAINVQDAIDEINAAAGTVSLVDNGDGTYDFTDAGGLTTTITDTSISTLVDNTDGTYTYTDESGATQTIDTNASANPYDNTTSGLTAINVQDAIDEINAAAGTVSLVDNGDGTYDFTDAGGLTTTITDTSISTLVDNTDGTYTYTDESGATQTIDTNASANPYDNTTSGLTAINVQDAIDEINAAAGTVSLVDNGDGTYDFTDAGGLTTTITDTSISTLVDNTDGTYTYTDESGATQTIDTNASANPYDNTTSGLTAINVQDAIDEINAAAGTVSLVDNGDGTYDFTDAGGLTTTITDTSISTLVDNTDGTYTYTDESGATQTIDTNASANPYDNTTSGLTAINVQDAIDEINAAAGTVSLVDNGDGTYDFTDAGGLTTTITDTSISTLVDNTDGTYTYTDESGATQTIDTNASANPYDNTTSGLTAINVQDAIDEINAAAGTVSLVDNGDGTYDFTDAGGLTTTITDTSISTLVDNTDGTYTYTDESGATQTIDTNASANPYDNTTSGLTAINVQDAIDEINAAAGTVSLVDNGDGTYDFTDAGGLTTTITDTSISTLVDNTDGTYTYTDESGATQTIDTNASANPYDNTTSGLTAINVQDAIDEINAAAGTVSLVDNGDGTYDFTDAGGLTTTITDTSISTLVDNTDGTYTYTDESGATQTIDTNASANPYDNTTSGLTAINVQDAIDEINAAAGTVSLVDNGDGTYDFTDAGGLTTTITDTSISTLVDNTDGTYTYTDESGATQTIDTNASANPYDNTTSGLTAINVQDAIDEINAAAGTVSLVDNGDGTYDFTDAGGLTTTITDTSISTLVDNTDGTYTYTDESGATQTIDTNASANPYDNTTSGLTAINVQDAIDEINAAAGTVSLVDNGDGTYDFTDAGGLTTTITDTSISTLVDNTDGTYTYTDESGATQTIDTNASANPYDNTTSGLTAINVQDAIDEINAAAGTVSLVDNGDGTYDFTDAGGLTTTITDTSISTLVDNTDGTYTYTDESGATQTIDTNASANPYDNTTSGLTAINVQDAIDEINSLSSDDQDISTTGAAGNITIEDGSTLNLNVDDADADATNEYNTGVAMNAGNLEVTDGGGTLSDNLISTDVNNDIVAGTDGALYLNVASVTISETITNLSDAGNGLVTYVNESGATQTVAKADLTDVGNGTYTFTNNDGTDVTLDTRATSNPYDNTTSGLTASTVQAAIDEVATGSTDDQDISTTGAAGNITIEDGSTLNLNVDDADADATNEYNTGISFDGQDLTITDGGGNQVIDISGVSTDDQDISTTGAAGNITIEDGSTLNLNVDDADADASNEVNTAFAVNGANLELTDSDGTLSVALADLGSDDQDISTTGAAGNITIEDGSTLNLNVDDADADASNEVNTAFAVNGANLELTDSDGTLSVALADLGSDDQDISTTGAAGNITIEDGSTLNLNVDDADADASNEVNTAFAVNGANLELTDSDGTLSVALADLGSDDQDISTTGAAGNITIEDGSTLNLNVDDADADASNEVNTAFAVNGANLELTDSDGTLSVALADLGTDDQDISTTGAAGNITIEDGSTLNLNVDDADADASNEFNTAVAMNAGSLEITDGGGTLSDNLISTDVNNDIAAGTDGALYLNVASVTISETITNLSDTGNGLVTYVNESGATQTVAKADLTDVGNGTYTFTNNDGTDVTLDTRATSNPYDNTTSGLTASTVQAAIDEVATGSTDDQDISTTGAAGNITIEDGSTLNLNVDDADADASNEVNTAFAVNGANLELTDSDGTLSVALADLGSDDQDISTTGAAGNITIEDGSTLNLNVDDADADASNEVNTAFAVNGANLELTDSDGTLSVALADLGSDDQILSTSGAAGNIQIENGNTLNLNVDDADSDATNEYNTGISFDGQDLTITDGGGNQVIDISGVSTDDQDISTTGAAGNITIEDGSTLNLNVDDADADATNEYNTGISFDGRDLTITDGGGNQVIDISSVSTDDQDISTTGAAGNITIEDGSTLNLNVDDADADATNEYNTGISFDGQDLTITDGGGNQVIDISGVSTDDQDISTTGAAGNITIEDGSTLNLNVDDADADASNEVNTAFAVNGANLELTDSDGTLSVALADLGTDDQDISTTGAAGNITIEDGSTLNLNVDDADADASNEVNTAFAVNGANLELTDSDGTLSVALADLGTDDQILSTSGAAGNIQIENGNTLNLNVDDADADASNEVNTAFAVNGANLELTDSDGTLSVALADLGSDDQDISTTGAAGNITIEDGSTLNLNVDDADADASNEVNTAFAVNGANLELTDSDGTLSVALADLGSDDQILSTSGAAGNIQIENGNTLNLNVDDADADATNEYNTGISFDGTDLTITDGGGNQVIDISGVSTDDQDISTTGAAGNITIEDGSTLNLNVDDADADASNEVNTAFAVNGANLELTDSDGTLSVALADLGSDDQILSTSGAAGNIQIENGNTLNLNVDDADADATNEYNTGISFDGTDLTITDGGGNQVIDISGVSTDDQDISTTGAAGNITIEDGSTLNLNVDDADADASNEVNTAFAVNGANLELTDSDGTLSVALADLGSDDQILSTSGAAGNIQIENGNTLNLNVDDADADATNEYNTGISFDGTDLTITDGGGNQVIDISGVSTDDQDISTTGAAGNITIEDGSTLNLNVDDADADASNEVNTAFAVNGANLELTDSDGTLSVALADLGTDDQDISTTGAAGNITIEDGSTLNLNVDDADADASNEVNTAFAVNGANLELTDSDGTLSVALADLGSDDQDISTTGAAGNITIEDGSTLNLNVDDADADASNEVNTAFAVNGANLELTDSDGTLSVALADLGSDDQILSTSGAAGNIQIENGNTLNLNVDDADADATNEYNTGISFDGTDLTITDGGGNQVIDISGVSTDDQDISTTGAAGNITIEDGSTLNLNVDDADADASNEVNTAFAVNGANLELTDSDGTLSVALADLGTDDQDISTTGAAGNITIEDGSTLNLNVDDADADASNEVNTAFAVNGANLELTDSDGTLSVALADLGSDDQILSTSGAAGNIQIENGNTLNLNVDDADADATNEYNTGISFDGTDLTITDGGGNQVIDISGVSTDDQDISTTGAAGNITIEDGSTLNLNVDDADADASNEVNTAFAVNGANLELTDSDGTLSVALADLGSDDQILSTSGAAGNIQIENGNTLNLNVDDADADASNEVNTAFAVNGANLELTDSDGTLSVALADLGTDDQFDDEVSLRTPIDVNEGGVLSPTNETTVEEVIQAIAPITSKAARIFYPPSIAINASVNGTGFTENLYQQYLDQYGMTLPSSASSAGAPSAIPTYASNELYYYVTYYDPAVFANVSISATGVMTYNIIGQPADYNSLINVVFVVK